MRLGSILEPSGCRLWAVLRPSGGLLGPLGALLGRLGPVLGPSWGVLGPSWGLLGPSWRVLGPLGAVLGASWRREVAQGCSRALEDGADRRDARRQKERILPLRIRQNLDHFRLSRSTSVDKPRGWYNHPVDKPRGWFNQPQMSPNVLLWRSKGVLEVSRAILGRSWGILKVFGSVLGTSWAVLRAS